MWEQLMKHLKPSELETIRGALVEAITERLESIKADDWDPFDDLDSGDLEAAHYINRAINQIDANM